MRHSFRLLLAAVALLAPAMPAGAQTYPSRPIRLISPNPAGGANDTIVRVISAKMSSIIGGSIVVDNRGGAGGSIATDLVARADPDGYTLLFALASHTTTPFLYKSVPYDPLKSFDQIGLAGTVAGLDLARRFVRPLATFAMPRIPPSTP